MSAFRPWQIPTLSLPEPNPASLPPARRQAPRPGNLISRPGFPAYVGASPGSGGRQSKMVNITVIRRGADLPPGFACQGQSEDSQGLERVAD